MCQVINYDEIIKVPGEGLSPPDGTREKIRPGLRSRIDKVLIPKECILERVKALAHQICEDYKGVKVLYIVPVLKGASVFDSDLERWIYICGGPELRKDFYKVQTYGADIKVEELAERKVKIEMRPKYINNDIDVLLLEDIVDDAFTLTNLKKDLIAQGVSPSKLKICVLLNKILNNPPLRVKELKKRIALDYVGFEIPDRWIAGYGIDAGEHLRELPFIVAVNEDYYRNRGGTVDGG